jgi:mannose-6-phosphate isomerase-like protein (cupin superfamily)
MLRSPAPLLHDHIPAPTPTPTGTAAAAVAVGLAVAADSWLPVVRFRSTGRWTSLLAPDDAAAVLDPALHGELAATQVWLLTWLPGQGTPLHDHGRSAGAFVVVRGSLTERVVATGRRRRPARESTAELSGGRLRAFGQHHVHQVTNTATEPAVSVHVYRPALREMNTYDVRDDRLVRTGTERAGVDW